jgi:hypothetical protein
MALIWAVCLLAAVSQLQRGPTEQITLLPNQDGKPSAVIITTAGKDTVLDKPYQTAAVMPWRGCHHQRQRTNQEPLRRADRHPAATCGRVHRLLHHRHDNLTPESAAQLEQIKQQLASRPAPEIIVIGHTDTVAKREYNDALSMRRAETVKRILVEAGIAADQIAVQARGERELLIQTGDGVDEPRNRRVEIRCVKARRRSSAAPATSNHPKLPRRPRDGAHRRAPLAPPPPARCATPASRLLRRSFPYNSPD